MRAVRTAVCAALVAALLAVTPGPAAATNNITITGVCHGSRLVYEVVLHDLGNGPSDITLEVESRTTGSEGQPQFMAFSEVWTRHSNGGRFVSGDKIETILGTTSTSSCRSSTPPTVTRDPAYAKSVAVGNAVRAANKNQPGASGYTAVANAWNAYCAAVEACTEMLPTNPATYCAQSGLTGTGFKLTGGYVC